MVLPISFVLLEELYPDAVVRIPPEGIFLHRLAYHIAGLISARRLCFNLNTQKLAIRTEETGAIALYDPLVQFLSLFGAKCSNYFNTIL